jgi:Cu+-exporting ATPase
MTDKADRNVTLKVEGMSCNHCVGRVQKALDATPGVIEAKVDLDNGTATVRFGAGTDETALEKAVTDAGYPAKAA